MIKKYQRMFADTWASALTEFEAKKLLNSPITLPCAKELIDAYNKGRAYGSIVLGQEVFRNLKESQNEIESLQQDIERLSDERDGYKRRWEECETLRDNKGKGKGKGDMELGDVE